LPPSAQPRRKRADIAKATEQIEIVLRDRGGFGACLRWRVRLLGTAPLA